VNYDELFKSLIEDEGMKLKPYKCPAGKWTIGVGRNLEDNGITEGEARYMLHNDIQRSFAEVYNFFGEKKMEHINESRINALTNMNFNLGLTRFRKFKKMIFAIELQDWMIAANEMLDSKWAVQVGKRALRLAKIMREG